MVANARNRDALVVEVDLVVPDVLVTVETSNLRGAVGTAGMKTIETLKPFSLSLSILFSITPYSPLYSVYSILCSRLFFSVFYSSPILLLSFLSPSTPSTPSSPSLHR